MVCIVCIAVADRIAHAATFQLHKSLACSCSAVSYLHWTIAIRIESSLHRPSELQVQSNVYYVPQFWFRNSSTFALRASVSVYFYLTAQIMNNAISNGKRNMRPTASNTHYIKRVRFEQDVCGWLDFIHGQFYSRTDNPFLDIYILWNVCYIGASGLRVTDKYQLNLFIGFGKCKIFTKSLFMHNCNAYSYVAFFFSLESCFFVFQTIGCNELRIQYWSWSLRSQALRNRQTNMSIVVLKVNFTKLKNCRHILY